MEKQNGKPLVNVSRKQLFALWGTLITVLGTSVVPKIIDMLSDRPSITEVQDMIAEQTKALTQTVNRLIDRADKLRENLHEQDKMLSRLEGLEESSSEVVRDCCTRRVRDVAKRLSHKSKPMATGKSRAPPVVLIPKQKLPQFDPKWIQQKAE